MACSYSDQTHIAVSGFLEIVTKWQIYDFFDIFSHQQRYGELYITIVLRIYGEITIGRLFDTPGKILIFF